MPPLMVGIGAVFIDDIVLPTGQTYMGQLGGGVVHALMGAAIWGERPGIVAITGQGLPDAARQRLTRHLDTAGLHSLPIPQIRAWQIFEFDGTRRELYRVRETEPFTRGAGPDLLPPSYRGSRGFYLLQGFEGMRAWRAALPGFVLWEPLQQAMIPGSRAALRSVLQDCPIDVISPNLAEARAVYGDEPPEALVNALLEDGASAVALRMGASGSLVADRSTGIRQTVGAVSVRQIVDQTGAGNAYCGGLLLGLLRGRNLTEAALMGAVSASFCIEHIGVLDPGQVSPAERDRRCQRLASES
ncbi:MAG: hypothetical protein HXY41_16800 [Chloroflexi bacterium]|nr:hypothetical protein [Chloroflexota bacterium]